MIVFLLFIWSQAVLSVCHYNIISLVQILPWAASTVWKFEAALWLNLQVSHDTQQLIEQRDWSVLLLISNIKFKWCTSSLWLVVNEFLFSKCFCMKFEWNLCVCSLMLILSICFLTDYSTEAYPSLNGNLRQTHKNVAYLFSLLGVDDQYCVHGDGLANCNWPWTSNVHTRNGQKKKFESLSFTHIFSSHK